MNVMTELRVILSGQIMGYESQESLASALRARDAQLVRREADACDCWRTVGPLCARCKLRQVTR